MVCKDNIPDNEVTSIYLPTDNPDWTVKRLWVCQCCFGDWEIEEVEEP